MLNLKQAAARLGVHYMTVYRYVRQGLLAADRVGTEWRVSEAALASFVAARAPEPPEPVPEDDGGAARWRDRLGPCLLAGDEAAAWRTVQAALAAGHPPVFCYVDMLAGAMTAIEAGSFGWGANPASRPGSSDRPGAQAGSGVGAGSCAVQVAERHLATAVATRVVSRLGGRFRRPGRSRGSVVLGAPRGERHGLPTAIAADLVRLVGFDVLELGAGAPVEAFVGAVLRAPRLVGVGIGLASTEPLADAQATVDAIRGVNATVPVVVGGWAVTPPDTAHRLVGVTAWVADGREVMAFFDRV